MGHSILVMRPSINTFGLTKSMAVSFTKSFEAPGNRDVSDTTARTAEVDLLGKR